ncbi:MAG: hybrid sensor histidine kinase/response regulator [Desulfuromonas sp.]|nr:MAG: hybrid sensor histidine kinase/response regulator [Desulfuromonas sp.]
MPEKILVVDDERVILDLATMVLSARGYQIETAFSGADALDRVASLQPELILLDYMMPEMDGLTVLRQLRAQYPDTYVIMFTGKGSEELAVELMKAGASDYIRKPFNNQNLVERIENALKIRRIEIRNRELLDERERLLEEIAGWNCELEQRVAEKSRELELAQSEIIQAEKLGALGHLSARLAHEVRNPLNSINLFAQVLKQGLTDHHELGGLPEKIQHEIDRIDTLLIKLLSVSELSLGDLAEVNLVEVINSVLESFRDQLNLQNIESIVDLDDNVPTLKANESDIEQIFINLIANALQEMPDGGQLLLNLVFDDECMFIRVADTGRGIPEEDLHRLFDPFFTTKAKGTGFGLSAVLRSVKNCGGRIVADNRPEGGAVFSIELPRDRA